MADAELLVDQVLAAAVRAGEVITDVRLVGAGLTALLPAGQVAAPVRLADLAVAALVRAGDRIDVLATLDGSATAEVVAEGALVLAASRLRVTRRPTTAPPGCCWWPSRRNGGPPGRRRDDGHAHDHPAAAVTRR